MIKTILAACACSFAVLATAQVKTPQPSPSAEIKQIIGLTNVEITYSRPHRRDREVFGNLVPFDKMWRTGANKATSIRFGDDVVFGESKVKKGTYSLFTIPGENEWNVVLNSETELWGAGDYEALDNGQH